MGISIAVSEAWSIPQETPPQQGLSFTPEFQLVVTGEAYVVPFVLQLDTIYEPIRRATNMTNHIIFSLDEIGGEDFLLITSLISQHILSFQTQFANLNQNMNDFLMHIVGYDLNDSNTKRKTRGAINFIGSLANTLFGTATQGQVDLIHKRLQSLDTFTEEERKILNVHSKVINVTLKELTNVHQALEKLETATRVTKTLLQKMEKNIEQNEKSILSLEILLHIQLALTSIAADDINFKIGIQSMMETHISPNIVTNAFLLQLLDEISARHELLFPPKVEFLGLHRTYIRVIHKTASRQLSFYLLIPLRGIPADTFDVFRMTSLPFPVSNSDAFLVHQPSKKYLVINRARNKFFLVDDFENCKIYDDLLICPPTHPIYSTNADCCEVAVFLNKPSVSKICNTLLVKSFKPIFVEHASGWSYATSTPLDITVNCQNTSIPTTRHTINGTGLMRVNQGCSIHSDTFSLPASSTHVYETPLVIQPYPFATPIAFSSWEHSLIMNSTNITLPDSFGLEPWSVPQYVDQMQMMKKQSPPTDFNWQDWTDWLWIFLPIGILSVCLVARRMYLTWRSLGFGKTLPTHDKVHTQDPSPTVAPATAYQPCPHR